ncbi:MAG: hypothetical protein KR126chlam4_01204 [Candidatus Anoxychlamydiales bacterium]|nr:hypothetical protein [Candidatus Anoxychlamydiales bacterium]NGX41365.1 hypothetical protein [Candidatus Anoxychlamydiales bacterium]HEU64682.1 hypothetical protein [Chlamydiota bacterium]
MAAPSPKEDSSKEALSNLLSKLETEVRWCTQHPNDVSDIEMQQLKQSVDELNNRCKTFGGQFYKDFQNFRKEFDYMADHPNEIKTGDFQKFEDMIQQLLKDLK